MGDNTQPHAMQTDAAAPLEPHQRRAVAALKRVFELWAMDGEFHERYLADPMGALAESGLDVDPRAVSLLLLESLPEGEVDWNDEESLPETFVWFRDLMEGRARRNIEKRMRMALADARFRDWSARQQRRCERTMGRRGLLMSHLPVAFELSSGCSICCPFCALSAGRLEGVFRHTDDNAVLWRDVLAVVHEVVGDDAGQAPLYYATEPLDNPDYEQFLEDFYAEFGSVPQTTTAAATRNIKRMRDLLRWGQGTCEHFDRISVLNKQDFDTIIRAFSPEELLFTDLLPQFEDAPVCSLVRAGRNRDAGEGVAGTVACVSGFVINMRNRTVRLVTPVAASDEHPTGELVYETASFADGMSLKRTMKALIERHMHETISLSNIFG